MSPYFNKIKPWVTVICTAYNHENFIDDALQSVIDQQYPNVELIIIDNASSDQTVKRIRSFIKKHSAIRFIQNSTNIGLCRAFNQGLRLAKGKYIIDLSADDLLLPDRISRQVERFESLPDDYAVVFSNATYVNENRQFLGYHYPIDEFGQSRITIPTGTVFQPVLASYFICTPTMMIRKQVLDALGGYDEDLSFEDFDFWVRSARQYKYDYIDLVLTQKRQLANSLYKQVIYTNNQLLSSTLTVCLKAYKLCQSPDELQTLARRIRTFIRKAFYTEQFELAHQFGHLLRAIEQPGILTNAVLLASQLHLPVNKIYRQYIRWCGNKHPTPEKELKALPIQRQQKTFGHSLKMAPKAA